MSDISENWKNLKPEIGNFIGQLNSESRRLEQLEKKLQKNLDEAYNKGLQDAQNAIKDLYDFDEISSDKRLSDVFGKFYVAHVIMSYPMSEIIEKLNQLRAEEENKKQLKEQELHVGDEILVINNDPRLDNRTFVIYEIDDYHYYVIEPITFYKDGFYKSAYDKKQLNKTGKHYDSIPLSKEINSP